MTFFVQSGSIFQDAVMIASWQGTPNLEDHPMQLVSGWDHPYLQAMKFGHL